MIINYLKINNFRQFVGEHIINFSVDSEKKITLIMAESGFGKTTLLQTFQWILYGECKYKLPLNTEIKKNLLPHDDTIISCEIQIQHNDNVYTINRMQSFYKINKQIQSESSILTIDVKKPDGISTQIKGREADRIIKDIMHKDLYPYFFLEGESLTKVGQQMAKGKNGDQNEFVKAIKNLLGFNCLYEAKKHLSTVAEEYDEEIKNNTNDKELKKLIDDIAIIRDKIRICTERLNTIDEQIRYDEEQKNIYSDKVSKYAGVEDKQLRTKTLSTELSNLKNKINDQKRYIFKKFSSQSIYLLMNSLIEKANNTLKSVDCIEKGIPGINIDAINYLLENHKCLCGHEIKENTQEWVEMSKWLDKLPPNNISFEIEKFQNDILVVTKNSQIFVQDFMKAREDLNELIKEYNQKVDELYILNEEIGSVSEDVALLKEKEKNYSDEINKLTYEKGIKEYEKNQAENSLKELENQQNIYKLNDDKVNKLRLYKNEAVFLKDKIARFCVKKENEKRLALEAAINEIFKDFYDEKIKFILDTSYSVQIESIDNELTEDFASGGQDVAIALAFIGAIIKLKKEKEVDEDEIMEANSEDYPLVMDAPTSNFGMKQMKSFSEVMPKIANQIIVFINDKDGPILKENLLNKLGSEWALEKIDSYHSKIVEVK